MTKASFLGKEKLAGFILEGHSSKNCSDLDGKILCAAVSSAAYMAANTLTEIVGCECDIEVDDGYMSLKVLSNIEGAQETLKGFRLHLQQLSEQYSNIELNLEV